MILERESSFLTLGGGQIARRNLVHNQSTGVESADAGSVRRRRAAVKSFLTNRNPAPAPAAQNDSRETPTPVHTGSCPVDRIAGVIHGLPEPASRRADLSTALPSPARQPPASRGRGAIAIPSGRRIALELGGALNAGSLRAPQLFPSASGLGRDRRDADRGQPRRRRPVRDGLGDRACLSAGALGGAARPRSGRDRGLARRRALHAGRAGMAGSGSRLSAASSAAPACRCCSRCCRCSSPISARPRRPSPAPSTCSTPIISAASMR